VVLAHPGQRAFCERPWIHYKLSASSETVESKEKRKILKVFGHLEIKPVSNYGIYFVFD
jgi:hypothetical protein